MPALVGTLFAIVVVGVLLRSARQPHVVAYLVSGVVVGAHGLGIVQDPSTVAALGALGVILLLFFVGLEIEPAKLIQGWRVPVLGTLVQIGASVGVCLALARGFGWPWERGLLLGFVISLSSTALVVSLLRASGELEEDIGRDALGILLVQDLAIIPMVIAIGVLGGDRVEASTIARQVGGAMAAFALVAWLVRTPDLRLPLASRLERDHELQVFAALGLCFGLALVSALAGLSTALGAFLGGIAVRAVRQLHWVEAHLEPFRIVLMGVFFLSVGLALDVSFLTRNAPQIAALIAAALIINTVVNGLALRLLGYPMRRAIYGGALLAQVGEFSFVLAAVGLASGLITNHGYQLSLSVISGTLIVGPAWIAVGRAVGGRR